MPRQPIRQTLHLAGKGGQLRQQPSFLGERLAYLFKQFHQFFADLSGANRLISVLTQAIPRCSASEMSRRLGCARGAARIGFARRRVKGANQEGFAFEKSFGVERVAQVEAE